MIALATAALALTATAAAVPVERGRFLMGTLATGVAEHADAARGAAALEAGFDEIVRLERVMSSWREDSELSRLNAAAGTPFSCSPDLHAVVDSALALARLTGGAFDPTLEPLARAWDMGGEGRVPDADALAAARARIGWERVELSDEPSGVRLEAGMGLDLGGIGKGYALDRAAQAMQAAGVARGLLNLGGEIRAWSPDAPWDLAVAHPADRLRPAVRVRIRDGAVSTSGQSERGVDVRGRHYGHVLDPFEGRPVPTRATVTVVGPGATRTDALAKALLVLGRDRAEAVARGLPGVGVLWLEPDGAAVRAWRWNAIAATAEPGVAVRWMNPSLNPEELRP